MGFENFSVNMSDEACHLFMGMAVGPSYHALKYLILFCVIYCFLVFVKPTFYKLGEKLRDKIFKERWKI